jgi:SAM-dependent methyltransferase
LTAAAPISVAARLKKLVPWWAKILIKVIWARLPVRYSLWKRVGIFRHGFMESPDYVANVFLKHWDRVHFARKGGEFSAMELGCGDSLASCLMGRSMGAVEYYLIDVGAFAATDIDTYKRIAAALSARGRAVPDISCCQSVEDMLDLVRARYLTEGLKSLRALPDGSLDFIWSQAVLEHVRYDEFADTMRELRRIIRCDGVVSHRIDLMDHLGGALNNLRFSRETWESDLMTKSGFYTNRIRFGEMIELMRAAGFHVDVVHADRWDTLPTSRTKLAPSYRSIPEEDLLVRGFDAVLRPV